jgi:hypothetical protein
MIGTKPRVETDALAADWESALDAATRAVDAGRSERLSARVLEHERRRLTQERHDVGELLRWLAANQRSRDRRPAPAARRDSAHARPVTVTPPMIRPLKEGSTGESADPPVRWSVGNQ